MGYNKKNEGDTPDDAVIDSKCRQLFSGDKTLDELGGKLINKN